MKIASTLKNKFKEFVKVPEVPYWTMAVCVFMLLPLAFSPFTGDSDTFYRSLPNNFSVIKAADLPYWFSQIGVIPFFVSVLCKNSFYLGFVAIRMVILMVHLLNCFLVIRLSEVVLKKGAVFSFACALLFVFSPLQIYGMLSIFSLGKMVVFMLAAYGVLATYFLKDRRYMWYFLLPALLFDIQATLFLSLLLLIVRKYKISFKTVKPVLIALGALFCLGLISALAASSEWASVTSFISRNISNVFNILIMGFLPGKYSGFPSHFTVLFSLTNIMLIVLFAMLSLSHKNTKGKVALIWLLVFLGPAVTGFNIYNRGLLENSIMLYSSYGVNLAFIWFFMINLQEIYKQTKHKFVISLFVASAVLIIFGNSVRVLKNAGDEAFILQKINSSFNDLNVKVFYSEFLMTLNKNSEAFEIASNADAETGTKPVFSRAQGVMAQALFNTGGSKKMVLDCLEQSLSANPNNERAFNVLVKLYVKFPEDEEVSGLYSKISSAVKPEGEFYFLKAMSSFNKKEYEKGYTYLDSACLADKRYCSLSVS